LVVEIRNFRRFDDLIGTAGQPTKDELVAAAEAGYQEVVNLATTSADAAIEDEAALVTSLGMGYHSIPVVWDRPKRSDFDEFLGCMRSLSGRKVLVHCAANYRVTAFVSLYAMIDRGWTQAEADAFIRSVWNPEEYPAWQELIETIRSDISPKD
jgi:protein tyrosine phosphatase (PTP) superfamily phosphohydrolase (DUF442 family)